MVDSKGGQLGSLLVEFVGFIGDLPLVAFNASFDMGFLQHAATKHGLVIDNLYSCAMVASRRAWPGLPSHSLSELAKTMNLSDENTHRALCDCDRTRIVFLAAASVLGKKIKWSKASAEQHVRQPQTGLAPRQWPAHVAQDAKPGGILFGEVVVFTGSLSISRRAAAYAAAVAGCRVDDGVTKHTTLLVVGDEDLRVLAGHEKSSKHRKAEQLIREGQAIRILSEADFRSIVLPQVSELGS